MFIGSAKSKLDQKNRIKVPRKILKQIQRASNSKTMIITLGVKPCPLFLWTDEEWREVFKKWDAPWSITEAVEGEIGFYGLAEEVELDSSGRFLIPEILRPEIAGAIDLAFVGIKKKIGLFRDEDWKKFIEEHRKDIVQNVAKELDGRNGIPAGETDRA